MLLISVALSLKKLRTSFCKKDRDCDDSCRSAYSSSKGNKCSGGMCSCGQDNRKPSTGTTQKHCNCEGMQCLLMC
jgi:hypothetical protein